VAAETQALTDADFTDASATTSPPVQSQKPLSDSDFSEGGESSVSAPPVPQATTLVADKNVVLSHPADMSHDQVNDAVQTQVYGKSRIDMHQNVPLTPVLFKAFNRVLMGSGINAFTSISPEDAKKILPETGKAAVRGIENIGVGMAGLSKWFGETLGHGTAPDISAEPEWVQNIGKHLSDIGQSAINWLHERQQKGFETPDPEVFRGSFTSNPSYSRLAASVAQGIPALGAAAAVTVATANPIAGAGALGLMGAGEEYSAARESGAGKGQASGVAALSGVGNTLLMSLPIGHFLEGFGRPGIESVIKGGTEFAGISAVMTPFNNIVSKLGGDKSRKLFDGMAESILSGAVSGGILGGFSPGRGAEVDGMIQDAHKAGVSAKDIDGAREVIADQMKKNPESVMGAVDQAKFNQESLGRMKEAGQIVQDNPEMKTGARMVYNNAKRIFENGPRPENISPEEWPSKIDAVAKIWAAAAVKEAKRRGVSPEDVYRSWNLNRVEQGTMPDQAQQAPPSTGQVPPAQAGSSSANEAHLRIFPLTEVSSSESISQHPDFIKMSNDAAAVVEHYAKLRGIDPSNELADSLFREFHDKLGEIMKAQTPEERLAVAERIKAEHPDIENEFSVLRDKLWTDTNQGYFKRSVAEKYGSMRPKKGIEAENVPQRAKAKPIKYDETGLPERRPGSVVSTVTTADGDTVKITHDMILGEAAGLLQDAQNEWQMRKDSDELANIGKIHLSKSEEAKFKDVPWWVRKKFFTKDTIASSIDRVAKANGMDEVDLIDKIVNYDKTISKAPPSKLADYYDEGQRNLEYYYSNYQAESPEVEVEPGIFFQNDLFNTPKENIAQTYERLRQQGLDQGLNPSEAAKWAKDNLPREQKAIAEQKSTQTEFGAGGVQGFGQGRQGEQELFQPAYHGTPHKFDEFSLHKIGTGQGAQTYGWGLYFAGAKDVAEHYREQLAGKFIVTNWKIGDFQVVKNEEYRDYSPKTSSHEDTAKSAIIEDILINQADLEAEFSTGGEKAVKKATLDIIDDKIKTYKEEWPEAVPAAKKFRDSVDRLGVKMTAEKPGHIYTVDIPENHEYLDWDKSINDQSDKSQSVIKQVMQKVGAVYLPKETDPNKLTGADIYQSLIRYFEANPDQQSKSPSEAASRYLSSLGIPGLKYLDQQSRDFIVKISTEKGPYSELHFDNKKSADSYAEEKRKEGFAADVVHGGTSNYVLFDDKLIKITDFYQKNGGKEPKASVKFTPEGAVINLFKKADVTSILHESAHIWLKDMHDFVNSGKADEVYKADWKIMSDWLGIKEGAKSLTEIQQEKFARGFEQYLREGKSPQPGLSEVFARLKEWFTQVYKSAKALRVELTPEVRKFMDNMLNEPIDQTKEAAPPNKYVRNEPFNAQIGKTDRATAADLRKEYVGIKNSQIVRGSQLADEIRRMVPNKADREGMFWYKAANGDQNVLDEALNDPKLEKYHEQIMRAMTLPENARKALEKVDQYYAEAGQVSQETGTIKSVRENYQNRIYNPEPPRDYVKTETKQGLKQGTSHSKQRVFDTEFQAAQAGKTFATTDVADALSIHNEEMARVNTARSMADAMAENGLGAWKKEVPDGWAQVGTLEKRVPIKDKNGEAVIGEDGNQVVSSSKFVAPEGIAKGLSAIADPNFTKKIDALRNLQKYQGLAKTLNLSFSFFHHLSEAAVTLYQGGVGALMNVGKMDQALGSQDFRDIEQDFVKHTGMTSMVDTNMDILRNLVENKQDWFSKLTNKPGLKQVLETAEKGGNFLFGKFQRYIKVMDYGRKMSNWIADNPEATNAEVKAAKVGFAKEINAAYGGLNWEAMGMTKSNISLLRLGLLAPDWTISNGLLLKYALGGGTAGKASRAHLITALVGGMVLTEGINKMLTGHFTDENKEGHKLEIEIAPNVYVSLLRGGIGDISKLYSMLQDSGAKGAFRFAQGKLAPIPRGALSALSGIEYTGRSIYKNHPKHPAIGNTYDFIKAMFLNMSPLPFGASNAIQYLSEKDKSIPAGVGIASGLARYSKSGKKNSNYKM
jgi:hypothetical protein